MKSAILYATTKKPRRLDYTRIGLPCFAGSIWVRTVIVNGTNAEQALDVAKPRPGETVLNSIELPE